MTEKSAPQPEALRLAAFIDRAISEAGQRSYVLLTLDEATETAAELRRLHATCELLLSNKDVADKAIEWATEGVQKLVAERDAMKAQLAEVQAPEGAQAEIGEVTWQQAADAIENLDDYARMMVGVDPSGPRETLYRFLEQAKAALASKVQPKGTTAMVKVRFRRAHCEDEIIIPATDDPAKHVDASLIIGVYPVQSPAEGDVVVTWDHDRSRILAVTRQDREGHILKVISQVPASDVQPKGTEPPGWVGPELTPESMTDLAVAIGELSQAMGSPCVMGRAPQTLKSQTVRLAASRLKEVPAPAPAPEGWTLAPDYRGYAHLGTGQYVLNHSAAGEPPEVIISVATEEEKAGRAIGEERDNHPGQMLQPEAMAVRLRFASPAGLEALEREIRKMRETHGWEIPSPAVGAEPLGYLSEHTGPDGPFKWQFSKTLAGVYRDTALRIIPVYEPPVQHKEGA